VEFYQKIYLKLIIKFSLFYLLITGLGLCIGLRFSGDGGLTASS
jgi:hypothetical protein